MRKIHNYYEDIRSMASDNLNFVDRILILYYKFFVKFMQIFVRLGINDVMKFDERETLIVEKNKDYRKNIRNNLVDRTAPINMTIPATAPVMKKLDDLHNKYIKPLGDKISSHSGSELVPGIV